MPSLEKRLTQLRKTRGRQPSTHMLWVEPHDTPADIDAKRDRLIAAGLAHPDDTFVRIRWKRPGES